VVAASPAFPWPRLHRNDGSAAGHDAARAPVLRRAQGKDPNGVNPLVPVGK